ncbi:MAG: hypothetical protein ACT4ON_15925 [Bacteroidota bacterium]
MQTPTSTPVIISQSNKKSALDYLILSGVAVGGLWYARKLYRDHRAEQEAKKIGQSQETTSASAITQALEFSWLKIITGTNAKQIMDAIIEAFNAGKKYSDIAESYKKLSHGKVLDQDLKSQLSPKQYNTFLSVVRILSKRPVIVKGDSIVLSSQATIRKTPYINGTARFYDRRGNSIELVEKPGMWLGIATGKQFLSISRDTLLADSQSTPTLFLEMQVVGKDLKIYTVWVAASQIKVMNGIKPSTFNERYTMNLNEYSKAEAINKPFLEGVS